MNVYIPLYLRMDTSPGEAKVARVTVERLLSSPMVRMLLQSNGVRYEAIVVSDPIDEQGRAV